MSTLRDNPHDAVWSLACIVFLVLVTLAASGCGTDDGPTNPDVRDDPSPELVDFPFIVTSEPHAITEDFDAMAAADYPGFRLADWNDIGDYLADAGLTIQAWVDRIEWSGLPSTSLAVSRDGERFYGGGRHYFAALHRGTVPANFLVHAEFGDNYVDLGSWTTAQRYVLLIACGGDCPEIEDAPTPEFSFVVTSESHAITEDLDQAIKDEFGDEYRLADWNDIEDWTRWADTIEEWVDLVGWHDLPSTSLAVSRNGQRWHGGSRHYFAALHEGTVPAGFLVHDHVENHHIDLGSWTTARRYVLGIKD